MEFSGSIQSLSSAVAFAFICVFFFITDCRCSEVRISVGLSHNVSHPGDNVTLTCRVQGAQKETAVVWQKLSVNDADVERDIIGRDDQLSDDYRKLTKYDIYVIELPHVVISILTIHNVGVEESGLIGCSVAIDDVIYEDKILLQVFKQPSDISCSVDSDIFTMEGDNLIIQCIIQRVQPLPHISAHLGHKKNLTGHLTITNWTMNVHCGHQQRPVSVDRDSNAGHHCPVHFDYDVQFKLTDHVASYLDDGRELTIAVRHGQSGWPAMVKRLAVSVRYAPKFNCSYPTDVEFLSRNLVIVCRLLTNPALLKTPVVWWRHHRHHDNRTIHIGQSIDGYELREKMTSLDYRDAGSLSLVDDGKKGTVAYAIEFVIHKIQDVDFQSSFHFYAENEVGSTTKIVRIIRQTATTTRYQPTREPSVRPRGHHTKRPSSSLVQPINDATIQTIHPIICAAAMAYCLLLCLR